MIKNKTIHLSILALLILSIAFIYAFNHTLLSTSNSNESESNVDSIIYGNEYALHLTDAEKKWLSEHPSIRLGIDRAFPPFGSITKENEYVGFSADFMRIIEHRLGISFDIAKSAPWGETMEMAQAGELDMISALVNTKARQKFLEFTEPFIHNPTIIINDGTK